MCIRDSSSPKKLNRPPVEKNSKTSKKADNMMSQEKVMLPSNSKSQTIPKEGYENIGSSSKREGPIRPTGGFGVHPDSGERG